MKSNSQKPPSQEWDLPKNIFQPMGCMRPWGINHPHPGPIGGAEGQGARVEGKGTASERVGSRRDGRAAVFVHFLFAVLKLMDGMGFLDGKKVEV